MTLGPICLVPLVLLGSCARLPANAQIFVGSPAFALGGQARLVGVLGVSNNCISLRSADSQQWTLLFQAPAKLSGLEVNPHLTLNGEAFELRTIDEVEVSGAVLRSASVGWSVTSIRAEFSPHLPSRCARNVVFVSEMKWVPPEVK